MSPNWADCAAGHVVSFRQHCSKCNREIGQPLGHKKFRLHVPSLVVCEKTKLEATRRCFGQRKTPFPVTALPYEILMLMFSRAPNTCSDFHRRLSALGVQVTCSHEDFYSCSVLTYYFRKS